MNTSTNRCSTLSASRLGAWLPKAAFLSLWLLLGLTRAQAQTAYYWRGAAGANWSAADSWNTRADGGSGGTTRTTRLTDDILVFNGQGPTGLTPTVTMDVNASETIGQLQFTGGVKATLTVNTTNNALTVCNITVQGDAISDLTLGPDITVAAGSTLAVASSVTGGGGNGNSSNTANLNFILGQNTSIGGPYIATAKISGVVSFAGAGTSASNITHQFQGTQAGQVRFTSGSRFVTSGSRLTGVPFSSLTGVLATFDSGSTYEQGAGGDPYDVVTLSEVSTYLYKSGGFGPINTDRTYGNLSFQNVSSTTLTGTGSITVQNLTNEVGTVLFKMQNITIKRDLISSGGSLQFSPVLTSPVHYVSFTGTQTQFVGTTDAGGNNGALVFSGNVVMEINNQSGIGVTLLRPVSVTTGLKLTRGLLNTDATNILTLPTTGTVEPASSTSNTNVANTSFVNGPMVRTTPATTVGTIGVTPGDGKGLFFPIGNALSADGKTGGYRPIALTLFQTTSTSAGTAYTAKVVLGPPLPRLGFYDYAGADNPNYIKRVSTVRYYDLSSNFANNTATTSPFSSGRITIYYGTTGSDDQVDNAARLRIAKSPDPTAANQLWDNLGGTVTAVNTPYPANGFITSSSGATSVAPQAPFNSLGRFALASTAASRAPGNNPLPVDLTSLSASAQAGGVRLDWATASEKNSAAFEVERSADGTAFRTLASVQAQGHSAAAHAYSNLDRTPLAGLAYYRLRQVDTDGTVAYSQVVTARWSGPANALQVYPNPSTGTLYLSGVAGSVPYRIRSVQGQLLAAGETTGASGVRVQQLPAGTYLLEITTPGGPVVRRFVRE